MEGARSIALETVIGVLQGFLKARCEVVILSWVFARPELYEPAINGLSGRIDSIHQLYLMASREALRARLENRGDSDKFNYAVSRLELIENLPYPKIDTTELSPQEVANQVRSYVATL